MNIWESFVEFLQGLIREYGLPKLFLGLVGLVGPFVAVVLGFHPSQAVKVILALVLLVLFLLVTCLALAIDQNKWRNKVAEANGVLNRYGDEIVARQNATSFEIKDWHDQQYIDKNGDTTIDRRFTLVVGNPKPLQTFWHLMTMSSDQTDYKYRKKVVVKAKTFDPQTQQPGVNFLLSRKWDGNSLWTFVHLDREYQAGEEVRVLLQASWPGYTKELLENENGDTAEWTFRRNVTSPCDTAIRRGSSQGQFRATSASGLPTPSQNCGPDGRLMSCSTRSSTPKTPFGRASGGQRDDDRRGSLAPVKGGSRCPSTGPRAKTVQSRPTHPRGG